MFRQNKQSTRRRHDGRWKPPLDQAECSMTVDYKDYQLGRDDCVLGERWEVSYTSIHDF